MIKKNGSIENNDNRTLSDWLLATVNGFTVWQFVAICHGPFHLSLNWV